MKVTFEPAARDDLDGIFDWISQDNPRAALSLIDRIERKAMQLGGSGLAEMGRRGLVEGTRELLEWPYIIVYRVDDGLHEVIILSIVHGARNRMDPD
jgi:plasmid stabilization system protein ParE